MTIRTMTEPESTEAEEPPTVIDVIQCLPEAQRWVFSTTSLVSEIRTGRVTRPSWKERVVSEIVRRVPTFLLPLTLDLVGWIKYMRHFTVTLGRRRRLSNCSFERPIQAVSLGFQRYGAGATREEFLRKWPDAVIVHRMLLSTLDEVVPNRVIDWYGAHREARRAGMSLLQSLPTELAPFRDEIAANLLRLIFPYGYFLAWFRRLQQLAGTIQEVYTVSSSVGAFAARAAGLPVRYRQHGVHHIDIVFPEFDRIEALSVYDRDRFNRILPGVPVTVTAPARPLSTFNPDCIVIASDIVAPEFDMAKKHRAGGLISWARGNGISVVIRPHPRESSDFWEKAYGGDGLVVDDSRMSFDALLEKYQPFYLAHWYSTTSIDAILRGVIPMTFLGPEDEEVSKVAFPLLTLCLRWPADLGQIERARQDAHFAAQMRTSKLAIVVDKTPSTPSPA